MLKDAINIMHRLRSKHYRLLRQILRLQRRYRYVPVHILADRIRLKSYHVKKMAEYLAKSGLVGIRRKDYEGYSLTVLGLDVLALKDIGSVVNVGMIAGRFDVGKEADIHVCYDIDGKPYIIKVFRLGRTSFKKVRSVRPGYSIVPGGWIMMNVMAAKKEFDILGRLWERGVSVPKPLARSHHMILMEYIRGRELHKIRLKEPRRIFTCIVREFLKAYYTLGVIHADLSEYNILVDDSGGKIWIIDWPQWLTVRHEEALVYLERDIMQIVRFFMRKYKISEDELLSIFRHVREEVEKKLREAHQ